MLDADGWNVSYNRVYRMSRREVVKVPAKQPKRGRTVPIPEVGPWQLSVKS